jgi:hypothetical protein
MHPPLPPATLPIHQPSQSSYIKSLPPTKHRLLQTYTQAADNSTVWRGLQSLKQTLLIATDSSLRTHRGTFGWNIVKSNDAALFAGAASSGDSSSHRQIQDEDRQWSCILQHTSTPQHHIVNMGSQEQATTQGRWRVCSLPPTTPTPFFQQIPMQHTTPHKYQLPPGQQEMLGMMS